jgi:hypothetical protein
MKKGGPLTKDELLHLEHRCGVLNSFLEVFSDFSGASGATKEGRIFRGCMDGAIATCRALSQRFAVFETSYNWAPGQPCTLAYKSRVRLALPSASDSQCEALWRVVHAGNRSVCHLEDKLVDHDVLPEVLLEAIGLLKDIIRAQLTAVGFAVAIVDVRP